MICHPLVCMPHNFWQVVCHSAEMYAAYHVGVQAGIWCCRLDVHFRASQTLEYLYLQLVP